MRVAILYYRREARQDVASGFVKAFETALSLIAEHPGIGSARYGHELGLPGVRHRRLDRYPWLVFYIEQDDRIEIWRVLDARRDIPAWLGDPDDA